MVAKAVGVLLLCTGLLAGMLLAANAAYGVLPPLARLPIVGAIGALFYASALYLGFVIARLPLRLR